MLTSRLVIDLRVMLHIGLTGISSRVDILRLLQVLLSVGDLLVSDVGFSAVVLDDIDSLRRANVGRRRPVLASHPDLTLGAK